MPRHNPKPKSPQQNGKEHDYAKKKGDFSVLVDENDSSNESSTEDAEPCQNCQEEIDVSKDGVCCNFCDHWYCLSCSELKKAVYKALKGTPNNLMWFCKHCLTAFPGVKKMMLKMANLDDRVEKLENRVEKLEKSNQEPDKNNLDTIVREELKEIQDIEARKYNLVCFNMEESEEESLEDKRLEDLGKLKKVIRDDMQLKDSDIQIKNPVRLGSKRQPSHKRPLQFSVETFEMKRQILQSNPKIKQDQNQSDPSKKIYITPDLTKRQRTEAFKLREELRYRKNVLNERNIKISKGRIVTYQVEDRHIGFHAGNRDHEVIHGRTFTNSASGRGDARGSPTGLFRDK